MVLDGLALVADVLALVPDGRLWFWWACLVLQSDRRRGQLDLGHSLVGAWSSDRRREQLGRGHSLAADGSS